MPLGGVSILWNENAPADTDSAGAGASEIRSDKTSIRNAVGAEHFWAAGGGANTGYHLLGSARPFYDVQSNVSSSGSDGRLMVTSDTSRLFHVGSAGTMFLGGATALLVGTYPAAGQRIYWAIETGTAKTAGNGVATVTLPNGGFNGQPIVTVTPFDATKIGVGAAIGATLNQTQFEVFCFLSSTGVGSAYSFLWMSIGTRTF